MKNLYLAFRIWLATRRANKTYRALRAIRDSKRSGFTLIDLSMDEILAKQNYVPWLNFRTGKIDVAMMLEHVGSVSEKHLRADGYSEEEIKKIRAPYEIL